MAWYRLGTVTVTSGSATVTGVGTLFASSVREGDMFTVDADVFYEVKSIDSDSQITLNNNYAGETQSNIAYVIIPISTKRQLTADLADRVNNLIVTYRGKFDALLASTTELNYLVGVTSPIQAQINAKAPIASPTFTGTPKAPTPATDDNSTQIATTAYSRAYVTVYSRDTLRSAVEASSGGAMTVLYDDLNNPSYMFRLTPFNLEDIDPVYGTGVHPAFYVNGVLKKEIFIGAFQSKVISSRACSLPGVDPTLNVNFDTAKTYCTSKGAGWHLMTNWEWAAVALWCLKNEFQPRGNTNHGRSHETGYKYETGSRVDNLAPGTTSGTGRTLTGSGPASWRHNNTFTGIADLVGNISEWTDGLKLVDGKIYMPSDNNFNLAEANWPDTGVRFDSTATGDGNSSGDIGDPVISNEITKYAGPIGDNGNYGYLSIANWKDLTKKVGYNIPVSMLQAAIAPITLSDGTYSRNPKGALYVRNYGERSLIRGGTWVVGADAGLFCLTLINHRSSSSTYLGIRPAFVG